MSNRRFDRAMRMIEEYGLHSRTPVSLEPLEDVFPVRYDDLGGFDILGMIINPPGGWGASADNPARVVINNKLNEYEARITYAHEVGHGICHHVGLLSSMALGMEERHEREAWEVASLLLIPRHVIEEEREVSRIAAVAEVPEWLVRMWPYTNE